MGYPTLEWAVVDLEGHDGGNDSAIILSRVRGRCRRSPHRLKLLRGEAREPKQPGEAIRGDPPADSGSGGRV